MQSKIKNEQSGIAYFLTAVIPELNAIANAMRQKAPRSFRITEACGEFVLRKMNQLRSQRNQLAVQKMCPISSVRRSLRVMLVRFPMETKTNRLIDRMAIRETRLASFIRYTVSIARLLLYVPCISLEENHFGATSLRETPSVPGSCTPRPKYDAGVSLSGPQQDRNDPRP